MAKFLQPVESVPTAEWLGQVEEALKAIARKAIERKTGARGLRSIIETILLDTMYELPGLKGVKEVVISAEVVTGEARPLYIYEDRQEESVSSA